jgi:ComF family protein
MAKTGRLARLNPIGFISPSYNSNRVAMTADRQWLDHHPISGRIWPKIPNWVICLCRNKWSFTPRDDPTVATMSPPAQNRHRWVPSWMLKSPCLLCDRPLETGRSALLCQRCQAQLPQCQRDRATQRQGNHLAWGHYHDSLRRLMHQLKYQNQPAIAQIFGPLLASMWQQHALPTLAIVPIPLHPTKQASRGYNQAELIARSLHQFTGMPYYPQLLDRPKATQAQHGLSLADRQTNLQAAFRRSGPIGPAHPMLLVDDIYTTGATIQAATDCLVAGGHTVWGSLVVAR